MSGASAADVRSILSLPSSSTPASSQQKKAATPLARKPSGISRELYSLIGPSAPTLVAQVAKPRLKQKPNLGSGGSSKWYILFISLKDDCENWRRVWRSFKNSARTDGLELGHWVKASTDPDAGPFLLISLRYQLSVKTTSEYPFSRYNVKSPDYKYSQEEYTKLLEGTKALSLSSYACSYHGQTQSGQRKRQIIFSILSANTILGSTLCTTAMSSPADHLARWR